MENILKKILWVSIGVLFLSGCGANIINTNKILENFETNKKVFTEVTQFVCEYDYAPYEQEIDENEAIYGSFAISDFKELNKYVMVIEGGPFSSSTFYKEVSVPENVRDKVEQIFNLGYAFICQVNARDEEQIIYFRINDVKSETDRPHGVVYSQSGNAPKDLGNGREITTIESISENWYYYEQESYAEYKRENN